MEHTPISQDDIQDVVDMTQKLEASISSILMDNDHILAMSALISTSINYMLSQCKSLDDVIFFRSLFIQILNNSIGNIQIKNPDTLA